jgi:hypothetical protein
VVPVDRGGVGDPLKGEGGAGALVAQADPGATLQRVVLEDLPREERAGECPDGPQRGQLRLQTGDVDGQELGLILVLHDSLSPAARLGR